MSALSCALKLHPKASLMPLNWSGRRTPQRNRRPLIENPADRQRQHRFVMALAGKRRERLDDRKVLRKTRLPELRVRVAQVMTSNVVDAFIRPVGRQVAWLASTAC
ncbi:hypothetical protein [Cupriavidus sp. IDO]|uniref:hypothetical protein n=1 Tax=Cupriavidus sp. IDO TaxID=1539142 RepID=UPI00187C5D3D|nr:hypothetical protein [Cupriavidus sp. IDO]